jgi:hypothetical protein
MRLPGRRQLDGRDPYANVHGGQLETDSGRHGTIDDGSNATEPRLELARRTWPEGKVEDFEKVGRRTYRDKASGALYESLRGAPMLCVGQEETRGVSCWFVSGGRITVLRPAGLGEPLVGPTSRVYARNLGPAAPQPSEGGIQ